MARYIQPEKARQLAYSWHGGQWSPLYTFASSGIVPDQLELLREIQDCICIVERSAGYTERDRDQLRSLLRFARNNLARIPAGYVAPWHEVKQ